MTAAILLVGGLVVVVAVIALTSDWWEQRQARRKAAREAHAALAKENADLRTQIAAGESLLAQLAAENTWLHDELNRRDTRHLRLVTGISDDDWFARLYDENGCPR